MGIGEYSNSGNGNNGNGNKLYENTYYSRLRFKNEDKLALSISFRSGLMIIDIAEQKEGFKYDTLESIYLAPTKALLFSREIKKFKEYYDNETIVDGKAFGVNAGMGEKVSYIGIHANVAKDILITIGKIDGNGTILEQATFKLNRDYHYGLEWDNIDNMELSKAYYDDTELIQLTKALDDFANHMSGALAYSGIDLARYDQARVLSKMDPIYDKLGIERRTPGGNSNRGSNNFLDNSSRVSNHVDNIDDIMGE